MACRGIIHLLGGVMDLLGPLAMTQFLTRLQYLVQCTSSNATTYTNFLQKQRQSSVAFDWAGHFDRLCV